MRLQYDEALQGGGPFRSHSVCFLPHHVATDESKSVINGGCRVKNVHQRFEERRQRELLITKRASSGATNYVLVMALNFLFVYELDDQKSWL